MIGLRRAAVAAILVALSACATGEITEPPEVTLADIRFHDGSLFEQKVGVVLRIRNPNDARLAVDGYRFALELNGKPFAKGMNADGVSVSRLSEATTEAEVTVTTLDIFRQLKLLPKRKGIDYHLTGALILAGGEGRTLPFEQSGRVELFKAE